MHPRNYTITPRVQAALITLGRWRVEPRAWVFGVRAPRTTSAAFVLTRATFWPAASSTSVDPISGLSAARGARTQGLDALQPHLFR